MNSFIIKNIVIHNLLRGDIKIITKKIYFQNIQLFPLFLKLIFLQVLES